ncbi:uncharacterized protein LOC115764166 isoform X2 [Drosophila novamexicana]|uniref:uncharacterized protein LOC115764166 isoform X2 n=1 Tax=Drosophila novamexicana TaxID=47314 RepID=UPI0011E5FFAF|nr:uncharacterized protein LOC115764166 isoform X2 [Drosophila novamexicana]
MSEPFNDYLEDIVEELESPKLWSETSDFESAKNDVVYNLRTAAHRTRLYTDDRYDVMLELLIPSYQKISSFENNDNYVCLDVSDVPYDLPISDQKDLINRHLLKNWLDDIFLKAFDRYINSFWGSKYYELTYELHDMSHVVFARSKTRAFKIVFVPSIKCVLGAPVSAITKLVPGSLAKYSFLPSQPEVEHNRLQVDVVRKALILLQALCEAKGLTEIRYYQLVNLGISPHVNKYAITTTLDDVFLMLLAELCDAVESQHLAHYFLGDLNLLGNISCEELYEYESILDRAYSTLSSYVHQGALSYERCRSHFE